VTEVSAQQAFFERCQRCISKTRVFETAQILNSSINPNIYCCKLVLDKLFKTRGFCFEDTHLTEGECINKMIALLALAFAGAHLTGAWLSQYPPMLFKKPCNAPQKALSGWI
jgi:hypothetical protein